MENEKRLFLMSQTYATLFAGTNKLQSSADDEITELTSRQLMTLIAVMHIPKGEVTLNAISMKIGATKQSTAQIVNNLKKKGYLISHRRKSDARSVNLDITEAGQKVFEKSNKQGWAFLKKIFNDFTDDELEQFLGLLKKLYNFDGESHDGFEADGRKFK